MYRNSITFTHPFFVVYHGNFFKILIYCLYLQKKNGVCVWKVYFFGWKYIIILSFERIFTFTIQNFKKNLFTSKTKGSGWKWTFKLWTQHVVPGAYGGIPDYMAPLVGVGGICLVVGIEWENFMPLSISTSEQTPGNELHPHDKSITE